MQGYAGGKAADQYLIQRVQAASPEQLVAMLLEGGQRFLNQLLIAMKDNDLPAKTKHVNRVSDIIFELNERLNHEQGGELVDNLTRIYEWWNNELFSAARLNQPDRLRIVQRQMGDIRSAWEELHLKKSSTSPDAIPPASLEGLVV